MSPVEVMWLRRMLRETVSKAAEVKEDKYGEMSSICCHKNVTGDLCQSCFGAVVRMEPRLKLFTEDFGQKGKVQNWSEVIEVIWVQYIVYLLYFEYRSDDCGFEEGWN